METSSQTSATRLFHGDDEDAEQKHFPISAAQSDDNILADEK